MSSVFVVQHVHVIQPQGEENLKLIGVYRSLESARSAVERLSREPGFREFPRIIDPSTEEGLEEGFHISEYQLDKDHWISGFVTLP